MGQGWRVPSRAGMVSVVVHGCLLAVLLVGRRVHVTPLKAPGTAWGSRVVLRYSPGSAASKTAGAVANLKPAEDEAKEVTHALRLRAALPAADEKWNARTVAEGGNALGEGSVTVALAEYFPTPRPDLTRLARGTRGDVVVDVVIDASGRVVETTVASGLGAGVDEVVVAAVQTWTFHPATKNGVAVASEQELLFHYERS